MRRVFNCSLLLSCGKTFLTTAGNTIKVEKTGFDNEVGLQNKHGFVNLQ